MKKLITILLVLALVLALAPMALASEEAAVGEDTVEEPEELGQIEETEEEAAGPIDEPAPPATSGTFGLGMAWELSEDGVLTISGTGPMWLMGMPVTLFNGSADPGTPWIDVTWGDPQPPLPWREVTERIKTVIIEPGVTDISANAFYLCNSITSVTIPDTVTSISACAFYFCRNLQDVYYTGSESDWSEIVVLEFNGPLANAQMHYNCDLFEEAGAISGVCGEDLTWTLTDDGVLTISGTGEMKGFPYYEPWGEKVTTLVIEPGVTGIDELLFLGCNNLTTVTIPDSVTSIGEAAFWCCENLTDVRFGVGLMSIGVSAFGNCKRLADVYYAGTERGWAAVRIRIGNELLTEARMHYEWTPEELPPETPAPEPPALTLSDDAARAQASGGYEGLYARAALVLDNGGVSGLYVTQVAVDTDGTIVIPEFRVPGLTVKGVNVSLVPTLADIRSPTPKAEATATKMLSA